MARTRHAWMIVLSAILVASIMAPAWAATKTVEARADNTFSPKNVTIKEGDTVNFVWKGGFHDVVFSDGTKSGAPTDTGSWSRTFSKGGTYAYICTVHEALGMVGTVVVEAAAATTTTSTTAPSGSTATTTTVAAASGSDTATTTTVAASDPTTMPYTGPDDTLRLLAIGSLVLGAATWVLGRRGRFD